MSGTERRRRIGLRGELLLALLPTATVLAVLALIELLGHQRLLFASLASSAFLVYLDPQHEMNRVRTLVLSQLGAAVLGLVSAHLLGAGYASAGVAMVLAIGAMVLLDAMHPPAVSTALSFGMKAGDDSSLALFALAVGVTAVLVALQCAAVWLLRRALARQAPPG